MPIFKVQAPDGQILKVQAADEATAMRGAQEHYASLRNHGPKEDRGRRTLNPALRKVDAAVRGAADMLTFGFADELAAASEAPFRRKDGQTLGDAYSEQLDIQRNIDQADREDVPVSRGVGQVGGFAGSIAGGAVVNAGRLVPTALRGGGTAGNMARGAVAGAGYGGLSAAGGGDGGVQNRLAQAVPGAALGAVVGAAAPPIIGAIGAGVNALANRAAPPIQRAANALASRVDPAQAGQRINDLRAAGAEPSLINGLTDGGRGFVAALAKRNTPARDLVQQRANAARVNLPGRVSNQARRHLSQDPRAPGQIAEELGDARGQSATRNFGAVRSDVVQMAPETVQALRNDYGRRAITEAANRERDPEVAAALRRLSTAALDDPSTPITVGMADRISRVLLGQADEAARRGDNDLAATLGGLGRAVREPTAQNVPGYRQALDEFGQQSRVMQAAEQGEDYLLRNTDEFAAAAPAPGQPGNELARATARRAVERRAGESPAGALSTAESIGIAPEQMARTRAILPEAEAQALERGMNAEVRTYRELQQVAPRTGSQTNVNAQDESAARGIATGAELAGNIARGNWVGPFIARLKTMGISDRDAEAVASIATDPAQVQALLQRIEAQGNPQAARQIGAVINQFTARQAGEATAQN